MCIRDRLINNTCPKHWQQHQLQIFPGVSWEDPYVEAPSVQMSCGVGLIHPSTPSMFCDSHVNTSLNTSWRLVMILVLQSRYEVFFSTFLEPMLQDTGIGADTWKWARQLPRTNKHVLHKAWHIIHMSKPSKTHGTWWGEAFMEQHVWGKIGSHHNHHLLP